MPKTLLAVDDSATIRKVLEITFAAEDFRVVSSDGASGALAKLNEDPVAVVIDTSLVGDDGYALARDVRAKNARTAIVLMASRYNPYDVARGRDAGVDDSIDKPFDTQALIDKVRKAVTARENMRQAAPAQVAPPPAAPGPAPLPAGSPSVTQAFGSMGRPAVPGRCGRALERNDGGDCQDRSRVVDAKDAHPFVRGDAGGDAAERDHAVATFADGPLGHHAASGAACTRSGCTGDDRREPHQRTHVGTGRAADGRTAACAGAPWRRARSRPRTASSPASSTSSGSLRSRSTRCWHSRAKRRRGASVVWEVVPPLAEMLIKEEIARLTKEA